MQPNARRYLHILTNCPGFFAIKYQKVFSSTCSKRVFDLYMWINISLSVTTITNFDVSWRKRKQDISFQGHKKLCRTAGRVSCAVWRSWRANFMYLICIYLIYMQLYEVYFIYLICIYHCRADPPSPLPVQLCIPYCGPVLESDM